MKHTKHYRMYAEVFGIDVPLTQSQPTESTQGTHRTLSAPRSPTPKKDTTESSAPKRSIMIRFRLPKRRSTRLTPPALVPTIDKAYEMILQDTIHVSLTEHKSQEEQEARENIELVNKHLASEEIENMIPGTRLEPRSDRESSEVEITNDEEVEITNVVIHVNVNEEEEEITDEVYELKQREKGKIVEESRITPFPTPIRSPRTHTNLISSDTEKLQELTVSIKEAFDTHGDHLQEVDVESLPIWLKSPHKFRKIDHHIPFQVDVSVRSYMSGHILHVYPAQSQTLSMKFENLHVPQTTCRPSAVRPRDQDDHHDDAHPEGENSAKRQKTSEYEACVSGESSSGQVNEEERGPSTLGNQEQIFMEELSLTIDEAKLKKMADEMLRQRCTSGDEHQHHIDQMKNFLKNDIVWETPPLSLINQDLLYLKKGSLGPEKIVLSLHKFPAIIFNDDDIEERTSRWVNKCVKKFNPYARYGVEHWKNPHAKIFYIRKQKEPGKPKEVIYSNSKIIQVIKTYWELGHEHKFITEIVARRANECIVSITEPDYKNLNKNDIKDMYLLIMNGKVPDYAETGLLWSLSVFIRSSVIWERVHDFQLGIESYQQKVNLTAPTISFPGVEKQKMFSIIYEPVHGIIYNNSKKEKRVMRHSEIHKFCDATLIRVLKGLKSYNNDVKYGYVQRELTNDEVEYLKLFEEEIKVRLKYRNQMRR
ncbi:hypothetical protein Tco_0236204 [Tanacetum coccineum]